MTFDDLKQMEGQIIDYYEVKGNSIKAKKGKIRKDIQNRMNNGGDKSGETNGNTTPPVPTEATGTDNG